MSITQLDTENADRNIATETQVLTYTDASGSPTKVGGHIMLGDGTNDLDGSGGSFTYRITVAGQNLLGGAQTVTLGTQARSMITLPEFILPANATVTVYVDSPNAADTNVDVTCSIFDIAVDQANLDGVTLADDAITAAKFDESTAFPLRENTLNESVKGIKTASCTTGTLTTSQFTTNLTGFDDDRLIGRSINFTSAPLDGESADITDYQASSGLITIAGTLTEAPINGTTFFIA